MAIVNGDLVRLVSGGPVMTVQPGRRRGLQNVIEYECVWFSRRGIFKDRLTQAFFAEPSLEIVRVGGSTLPVNPIEKLRAFLGLV